jgi:hypothetical protein
MKRTGILFATALVSVGEFALASPSPSPRPSQQTAVEATPFGWVICSTFDPVGKRSVHEVPVGQTLHNPTFKYRNREGQVEIVVQAKEVVLKVNPVTKHLLIHMRQGNAVFQNGSQAWFENRVLELPWR